MNLKDSEWAAGQLGNVQGFYQVDDELFNHWDFLWSINVNELLYDHILPLFRWNQSALSILSLSNVCTVYSQPDSSCIKIKPKTYKTSKKRNNKLKKSSTLIVIEILKHFGDKTEPISAGD